MVAPEAETALARGPPDPRSGVGVGALAYRRLDCDFEPALKGGRRMCKTVTYIIFYVEGGRAAVCTSVPA